MKKIAVLITIILLLYIFQSAYANNVIYGANIQKGADGAITLQLNTDYKAFAKPVFEKGGSVYFDIKNAKLSDGYKIDFQGDLNLVSQQIGSKVRIYLTGENLKTPVVSFAATKKGKPFNGKPASIFFCFAGILYLAQKFYSATIRLAQNKMAVKSPVQTAMSLNKQLHDDFGKKCPEIVLNRINPVKQDVYADFHYAKDKKNIKIAI